MQQQPAEIRLRITQTAGGDPEVVVDQIAADGSRISSTDLRELLAEYSAADDLRTRCALPWANDRRPIPLAPIVVLTCENPHVIET